MPGPLNEADLQAISARDEAAGDGLAEPDYECADDRHRLLVELNQLRAEAAALRTAQPPAQQEGPPWQSE